MIIDGKLNAHVLFPIEVGKLSMYFTHYIF